MGELQLAEKHPQPLGVILHLEEVETEINIVISKNKQSDIQESKRRTLKQTIQENTRLLKKIPLIILVPGSLNSEFLLK